MTNVRLIFMAIFMLILGLVFAIYGFFYDRPLAAFVGGAFLSHSAWMAFIDFVNRRHP